MSCPAGGQELADGARVLGGPVAYAPSPQAAGSQDARGWASVALRLWPGPQKPAT